MAGACVLVGPIVFLGAILQARLAGPSEIWHLAGLPQATIHAVAISHVHPGVVYVGTNDGVSRRDSSGAWRPVLASQAAWGVTLLPDDRTVLVADQAGTVDISH